jgi:hypothetical protein
MLVYAGKEITAAVQGRRLECVTCEHCQMRFYYELVRVGAGKGSAPFFLGQQSAADRAGKAAEKQLAHRLDQEAELVPCPKCDWINQDLIDRYRKRQYPGAIKLAIVIAIAGLIAAPIIGMALYESLGYNSKTPRIVSAAISIIALLSPLVVLFIRNHLRLRINPNFLHPRPPILPAGTPPALIESKSPGSKSVVLKPVLRSNPTDHGGPTLWAIFRPGQIRFPDLCVICLAPAKVLYDPPFKVNQTSEIAVPLCTACARSLTRRWWITALFVSVIALACAALLAIIPSGLDAAGHWIIFSLVAFFGVLVGIAVVPTWLGRPYRFYVVDPDRNINKFAASNPAYTQLLIDQIDLSQGNAT